MMHNNKWLLLVRNEHACNSPFEIHTAEEGIELTFSEEMSIVLIPVTSQGCELLPAHKDHLRDHLNRTGSSMHCHYIDSVRERRSCTVRCTLLLRLCHIHYVHVPVRTDPRRRRVGENDHQEAPSILHASGQRSRGIQNYVRVKHCCHVSPFIPGNKNARH
jgi:hypothetical protein